MDKIKINVSIYFNLYACISDGEAPNEQNTTPQSKLDINSYIPDVNRLYDYKFITGQGQKNVIVSFELIEKDKYRRIEAMENEYKINEA